MECGEVRDQFSALWEKELSQSEEAEVKNHLDTCAECQKDFVRFQKTVLILHSVEEVEVPGGFLKEIHEKMDKRKREGLPGTKTPWSWPRLPPPWKLPVQAIAMVAIVFLVLYLSKMSPVESPVMKDEAREKAILSEKERGTIEAKPPQMIGKGTDEVSHQEMKPSARRDMGPVASLPSEEKKADTLAASQPSPLKEKKIENASESQPLPSLEIKPSKEFSLRFHDRKEATLQVQGLIGRFGGEMIKEEGSFLLASIPASSLAAFEQEFSGLFPSVKAERVVAGKEAPQAVGSASEMRRREAEKKEGPPVTPTPEKIDRIAIRILLIQE